MVVSRVEGRSNRKCSIFGITHTATRAPFGHDSRGRSMIAEYSNRPCSVGTAAGATCGFSGRFFFAGLRGTVSSSVTLAASRRRTNVA